MDQKGLKSNLRLKLKYSPKFDFLLNFIIRCCTNSERLGYTAVHSEKILEKVEPVLCQWVFQGHCREARCSHCPHPDWLPEHSGLQMLLC